MTDKISFTRYTESINTLIRKFDKYFANFDKIKSDIALFVNPRTANTEQKVELQIELCMLQADPFFTAKTETCEYFYQLLPADKYPRLRNFGLKMTSMFSSTYLCESAFSTLNIIKSNYRTTLSDATLLSVLRLARTEIPIDINEVILIEDELQA
ncbi:EPM2A-interacting protein 1 [Mycetomoellerius zeteki]|uniref:EPM2A-interacting protein 1 n=1 Tax=Mycetomoellerius zeteki TaxID=64791 RepID=UPI00084E42D0|nr:PREDICTED: EPM2A-interacting protein 1-like [Trachymyrmex zeteki]